MRAARLSTSDRGSVLDICLDLVDAGDLSGVVFLDINMPYLNWCQRQRLLTTKSLTQTAKPQIQTFQT